MFPTLLSAKPALAEACVRHGIKWLALFGSVARGEATPESDADLLLEFEPGRRVTYLDLERIALDLSPLFGHRPVDLAKPTQLHWVIRDRVLSEAIVLYGRR
jgi:predicted nucleotidyltransferase